MIQKSAEKSIGQKQIRRSQWFIEECEQAIKRKKEKKEDKMDEFKGIHRLWYVQRSNKKVQ